MTWMPFLCLSIGFAISLKQLSDKLLKAFDQMINVALVVLMLTIGLNIGINESVIGNLDQIGFHCAVIAIFAIAGSVVLTFLAEKTVLPLENLQGKVEVDTCAGDENEEEKHKSSPLLWIMPGSIVAGIATGYFLLSQSIASFLELLLIGSLMVLYVGVGISLGSNRKVFRSIKMLGYRAIYLPLAILCGSLLGGWLAGVMLGLPVHVTVMSASGMSYYSLTGAYMTNAFGIETGTYGFVVNVMREFFTVIMLPLLIRISKGSPIASGAAGNMDTMLVPVTKFVGVELSLITLFTGVVLTFVVPFLLPLLMLLFQQV